jgi:hypothetical protein
VKKDARQAADRMISGKLRAKAGRSGAAQRVVAVDGTPYAWTQRHGWRVWGKGIKVISISVALHPKRTRELILDFAFPANERGADPSEVTVLRVLQAGIRSAKEAGWDPESRGRAFRYEMLEADVKAPWGNQEST